MISLGGQPVPLVEPGATARQRAGVHWSSIPSCCRWWCCARARKRVAVAVDALLAERDALIKDLDPPADALTAVVGGILLEDGSVAWCSTPRSWSKRFKPIAQGAARFRSSRRRSSGERRTILVVDDSFTTRTLEKSILEAHGYQVRVAVDGVEALDRAAGRAGRPGDHRHPDAAAGRLRPARGDEEGSAAGAHSGDRRQLAGEARGPGARPGASAPTPTSSSGSSTTRICSTRSGKFCEGVASRRSLMNKIRVHDRRGFARSVAASSSSTSSARDPRLEVVGGGRTAPRRRCACCTASRPTSSRWTSACRA